MAMRCCAQTLGTGLMLMAMGKMSAAGLDEEAGSTHSNAVGCRTLAPPVAGGRWLRRPRRAFTDSREDESCGWLPA